MRDFHTHSQPGLELEGGLVPIGRDSTPLSLQVGLDNKGHGHSLCAGRAFSTESKWSIMLRNLRQGMEYMERQDYNLNEMDRLIRLWRGSLSHRVNSLELSLPPETLLYLQTILRLSEEKLFNHSLFGSGAEPPIRIHLILGGKRFVQEVPVIPLLNKPGFQGLVYSGRSRRSPTRGHFDSCQTEFMNALLEVGKNLDGLRREYRRMSDESSSVMQISPPVCPSSETIVTPTPSSRFSIPQLILRIARFLTAKRTPALWATS